MLTYSPGNRIRAASSTHPSILPFFRRCSRYRAGGRDSTSNWLPGRAPDTAYPRDAVLLPVKYSRPIRPVPCPRHLAHYSRKSPPNEIPLPSPQRVSFIRALKAALGRIGFGLSGRYSTYAFRRGSPMEMERALSTASEIMRAAGRPPAQFETYLDLRADEEAAVYTPVRAHGALTSNQEMDFTTTTTTLDHRRDADLLWVCSIGRLLLARFLIRPPPPPNAASSPSIGYIHR